MGSHLRANLWLLVTTVVLCAVAYPLGLWAFGQTVFHEMAQGSIINSETGKPIGSKLIAQEFKGEGYFQPRPSAASYKGDASGASNWAASNYLLRDRVARQLGPIVRYGKGAEKDGKVAGELVGPDIEKWFQNKSGLVAKWAGLHSGLAEQWVKDTDAALKAQWKTGDKDAEPGQSFLQQLGKDDPTFQQRLAAELKASPAPGTGDVAKTFFAVFSEQFAGEWPTIEDYQSPDKQTLKKLARVKESQEIQAVFFDMWRQEHANIALEEVPADMVTASASGLDPNISLKNGQYQLKYRIVEARASSIILEQAKRMRQDFDALDESGRKTALAQARDAVEAKVGKRLESRLSEAIEELLASSAAAPLGGLAGVPLINVLEMNLALDARLKRLVETGK